MNYSKEFLRKQILRTVRLTGRGGIRPKNVAVLVRSEFPGATFDALIEDVDYLAGKGLLEFFSSPISAGDRFVRVTAAGIDFLESEEAR